MCHIEVTQDVTDHFNRLWDRHRDHRFVLERIQRCVTGEMRPDLSVSEFWNCLVEIINTTQTKSFGEDNPMQRFINGQFNIKSWDWVSGTSNAGIIEAAEYAFRECEIRFWRNKARFAVTNASFLRQNEEAVLDALRSITVGDATSEKAAADYLRANFKGMGLKQSRNLVQLLGLSHFQVPIDSRVMKQLGQAGMNIDGIKLGREADYLCLQESIWEIAETLGVLPCVFDAFAVIDE